ncbi:hypothetical protein [Altericroceibacterium endophyticum]|uniref:Uncharacterized protein n=1 Tax=Altericroceibacterium endophyticum TaxID=1808508 RepID=A0A6I4T3Q5_9SPHN|nr:hypothetical protein [Altericroceibacterium endophyticum]MXO65408.1 hypothetical protein [Altericroceibacterium endophyticum]
MSHYRLISAFPWLERLTEKYGQRAVGVTMAILLEIAMLALLLTLQAGEKKPEFVSSTVATFDVQEPANDSASEDEAAPDAAPQPPDPRPQPDTPQQPQPDTPVETQAEPMPERAALIPLSPQNMAKADITPRPAPKAPPKPSSGPPAYGPPDTGFPGDSEQVGTAPNGEPLYAASWYREPRDGELSGYLSTAQGPGWGLIACKTAPNYRVEDCVELGESPKGSNIARAVLAAAWQFKVRPPRVGGRPQIGSWVRIRIDYSTRR